MKAVPTLSLSKHDLKVPMACQVRSAVVLQRKKKKKKWVGALKEKRKKGK
jgi:hypothetical protein